MHPVTCGNESAFVEYLVQCVCSVQFVAVLLFLKLNCSNMPFICELLCILKVILTFLCVIVPLQNPWLLSALVLELKLPICVFCIVEYVHLCLILSIFSFR